MSNHMLTAFVNCTPFEKDGKWHVIYERDFFEFEAVDDADGDVFSSVEHLLETALDKGIIHSYYIKRKNEPHPIVRPPRPDQGNGEGI